MKQKIYIVEDDPFYAQMMQQKLSVVDNIEIEHFMTGESMLLCISEQNLPEIIIMDYNLTSKNRDAKHGGAIVRCLSERGIQVPVLMLSNKPFTDIKQGIGDLGVYDVLEKNSNALIKVYTIVVSLLRKSRGVYEKRIMNSNQEEEKTVNLIGIIMGSTFLLFGLVWMLSKFI